MVSEITPTEVGTFFVIAAGLSAIGVSYWTFKAIRRLIHVFDAVEMAAGRTNQAVNLIIHEFTSNGGRAFTHPPLETTQAQSATTKDLLLDLRSLTYSVIDSYKVHETTTKDLHTALLVELRKQGRARH